VDRALLDKLDLTEAWSGWTSNRVIGDLSGADRAPGPMLTKRAHRRRRGSV